MGNTIDTSGNDKRERVRRPARADKTLPKKSITVKKENSDVKVDDAKVKKETSDVTVGDVVKQEVVVVKNEHGWTDLV